MAVKCETKLSKNFIRECSYKPKQGLGRTLWLMNTEDIDRAASVLNETKTSISVLALISDASVPRKMYKSEGNDNSHKASSELVVSEFGNGVKHTVTINILYYSDVQRAALMEIVDGARLTAIVERIDTGINGELSYEVYGFEAGMVISEMTRSSSENSGVLSFTLTSKEGEEEATDAKIFMMNDETSAPSVEVTRGWLDDNTEAES